jgi:hypothetical protein
MRDYYETAKQLYTEETAKQMKVVVDYCHCVIAAKRCQELMVKHIVINDYREMATTAYVSVS